MFFLGVVLLNVYAIALILLRAGVYRTTLYRPMLWNVFLSILPVVVLAVGGLTGFALLAVARPAGLAVLIVTGIVWLLLLPNASYLITELNQSHRKDDDPVPLWYDIILVISLAMSGVMNTIGNVLVAAVVFTLTVYGDSPGADDFARPWSIAFIAGVMLLLGFGMYLGRYLRFDSWTCGIPGDSRPSWRRTFVNGGTPSPAWGSPSPTRSSSRSSTSSRPRRSSTPPRPHSRHGEESRHAGAGRRTDLAPCRTP